MYNNILDVKKLKVGQVEDKEGLTGCTVVICEKGAVCGVDVRGGGPGTRETDLLNPINMIQHVSGATCQIKITMICKINYRRLIRSSCIFQNNLIMISQFVSH